MFTVGLAALTAAPNTKAVTLGIADDAALVYHHTDDPGILDAAQAHNAQIVRSIVRADRPEDPYLQLAAQARDRGMTFHATLAVSTGQTIGDYAAWAAAITTKLQDTGVSLRVGLLNEPDLTIPAADACDPDTTSQVLKSAGVRLVEKQAGYTTPKTKIVRRRVRRGHRTIVIKRRVPVTRTIKTAVRRHGRRMIITRRVVVTVKRYRTISVPEGYETSATRTELTARGGCVAILRARGAAQYLAAAIPAIRAAAPSVDIGVGETATSAGSALFVDELARIGMPRFDSFALHPYWVTGTADFVKRVRDGFGPVTIDFTEFGVLRSYDSTAVAQWQNIGQVACTVGARSLIAYQWQTEPGATWDTSLLDPGLTETEQSKVFESIAC